MSTFCVCISSSFFFFFFFKYQWPEEFDDPLIHCSNMEPTAWQIREHPSEKVEWMSVKATDPESDSWNKEEVTVDDVYIPSNFDSVLFKLSSAIIFPFLPATPYLTPSVNSLLSKKEVSLSRRSKGQILFPLREFTTSSGHPDCAPSLKHSSLYFAHYVFQILNCV